MSHNILTLDEALFSLKFLVSFSPLPAMDVSDRKPLICSAMTCCDTLVSYLIILPFSLCLPWMTCTGILNLQCMFFMGTLCLPWMCISGHSRCQEVEIAVWFFYSFALVSDYISERERYNLHRAFWHWPSSLKRYVPKQDDM